MIRQKNGHVKYIKYLKRSKLNGNMKDFHKSFLSKRTTLKTQEQTDSYTFIQRKRTFNNNQRIL